MFMSIMLVTAGCSPGNEKTSDSSASEISPENLTTVNINVEGMTCTGCEQTIVKELESKDGVQSATASHTEAMAKVTYDKSKLSKEDLKKAIQGKGYSVESIE